MPLYNGRTQLLAGGIKTLQEIIQDAITARTYATAQAKADEVSRWCGAIGAQGSLRPVDGELLIMDAARGVLNGRVSNYDGHTMIAGDFTNTGSSFVPGQVKDLRGVALGSLLVYAVADTYIDLDDVTSY